MESKTVNCYRLVHVLVIQQHANHNLQLQFASLTRISLTNPQYAMKKVKLSDSSGRSIIFYCISNSQTVREGTDIPLLLQHRFLYLPDRIRRCREPMRVFARKHWQIVEVITGGENTAAIDLQHPTQFGQRRSLVICNMAEPGINIVPDNHKAFDAAGIIVEILVNRIRIAMVACD
jgi:hypothetical protein